MARRKLKRACLTSLVGLVAVACARNPPPLVLVAPWRERPIQESVADAVRPGMSSSDLIRLAGQAPAAGGVSPVPSQRFGAEAYSVHCDIAQTPDWPNSTWIYLITPATPSAPEEGFGRCLFVRMKDGVVVKAYKGRVVIWSM